MGRSTSTKGTKRTPLKRAVISERRPRFYTGGKDQNQVTADADMAAVEDRGKENGEKKEYDF